MRSLRVSFFVLNVHHECVFITQSNGFHPGISIHVFLSALIIITLEHLGSTSVFMALVTSEFKKVTEVLIRVDSVS